MNELDFSQKIKHFLDSSSDRMDRRTRLRLHEARQRALARASVSSARLATAGGDPAFLEELLPSAKSGMAILALVLSVLGFSYWNSVQRAEELAEVDSALLTDDLPINAYLDAGFDAWLKRSSSQ